MNAIGRAHEYRRGYVAGRLRGSTIGFMAGLGAGLLIAATVLIAFITYGRLAVL